MAKELGITQTQYDYLEREAKSTQTKILVRLGNIWESQTGKSMEDFWNIFRQEPH